MTLNEVTLLMGELNRHVSDSTRLLFSTAVDPRLGAKMSVTILGALGAPERVIEAAPRPTPAVVLPPPLVAPAPVLAPAAAAIPVPVPTPDPAPALERELVVAVEAPRIPEPPAPELVPAAVAPGVPVAADARAAKSKAASKPKPTREEKQEQMTFEPVNRGRFEKSEPTIVDGQDLDVPTFLRRNLKLK